MKRPFFCSMLVKSIVVLCIPFLWIVVGCQSEPVIEEKMPEAAEVEAATAVSEPEIVENTPIPPTEEPEPVLVTSADEMVGIWLGTVAGEKWYVMYTGDGRYTVSLKQDDLGTSPRVSGEYWFEDGHIHLRDLENAGHWAVCEEGIVGVYDVVVLEGGKLQFQTVEDGCTEGGFTRNYIFANMVQERIADPVPIIET